MSSKEENVNDETQFHQKMMIIKMKMKMKMKIMMKQWIKTKKAK